MVHSYLVLLLQEFLLLLLTLPRFMLGPLLLLLLPLLLLFHLILPLVLADILANIRSLSTERNQGTALRSAAGIELGQPTTSIEGAHHQPIANKQLAATPSQGSERVSTSTRQPPVRRASESAPSI